MDSTMIGALLKAYGAPNTPENINALTQRYASDPTAADRKITGLQGQSDESGGSRDAILNMMIDQTMEPQGVVTAGPPVLDSVVNSSVPTKRSATAARQPVNPTQLSNSAPSSGDPLANEVNQRTPANPTAIPPVDSGSGWEWLLPLLGIGAARTASPSNTANTAGAVRGGLPAEVIGPEATYDGPMNRNVQKYPYSRTRTDRITEGPRAVNDEVGSTLLSEPNKKLDNRAPSTVTSSPENEELARRAQIQAELDAANKEADAIMKQMVRQKGGGGTNWKPGLARRAFGR